MQGEEEIVIVGGFEYDKNFSEKFSDGKSLHEIKFMPKRHSQDKLIVIGIQQFAMISAPIYQVAVGTMLK